MYELSALHKNQVLLTSDLIPFAANYPHLDLVGQGATICKAKRNLGEGCACGRAHRMEGKSEG